MLPFPTEYRRPPYLLKLTVKDTENDLEYLFWWDLYIQSAFLDGLVISDTKDGATSDLTLVLNQKLTTNYAGKEEKIFRNILASGSSAAAYPGLLRSLTPMLFGYIYSSRSITSGLRIRTGSSSVSTARTTPLPPGRRAALRIRRSEILQALRNGEQQ